jgi:hypothetical protein
MRNDLKCELCGGNLDITATLIGCQSCGMVWGRCNGAWVEDATGYRGVKGGIEPSSPIPLADVPPSPHGSVRGTDAVCMPSVSAEPYRGIGRTGDCNCADDFTCAEHGGGHVLRDHK